jgi:hypothetical protein
MAHSSAHTLFNPESGIREPLANPLLQLLAGGDGLVRVQMPVHDGLLLAVGRTAPGPIMPEVS